MVLEVALTAALLTQAIPSSPPPARRGFQGALALQWANASGEVVPGLRHRDFLPAAMELETQLGWKLTDRFFAGIYLGGGVSMPGHDTREVCRDEDFHCAGTSRRAGVMMKIDLQPSRAWNAWAAVGGGVERHEVDWAARVPSSPAPDAPAYLRRTELDMRGVEPLRLMAGLDLRSTRVLGIGVHAALSFGRYREVTNDFTSTTIRPTVNLAKGERATHTWFTIGLHGLLFP